MKRIILSTIITALVITGLFMAAPGSADTDNISGYGYAKASSIPVGTLSDWDSLEELEFFLDTDDTDSHLYLTANEDGIVYSNNQCEDRAINLRNRAEQAGKRLETEILDRGEYYKWYGIWMKPDHYRVINKAQIDNNWYYVDPETDKVWLALYLD